MNFGLFLVIIRSRFQLILYTLAITVATAILLSLYQPNRYIARTSLVLNFNGENPFEQAGIPAQLSSSYISTQVDIINSRNVALKVIDSLKLEDDPSTRELFQESNTVGSMQSWLASILLQNLTVELSRDSRVIQIGYSAVDPDNAAVMANAFAQAYIATTLELSMEPARRSAEWFNEQLQVLRQRLEAAQSSLTSFQQEKGIVVVDERLGTEISRLNELSKQYVEAQAQTYNVKSRQLGKNHPEYLRAIKQEGALRYSMEEQKKQILELKQQRDQLDVLAREVENERQNYEATLKSYYQTRLESQFNQTNISILNLAYPPSSPDSPNVLLNIASAIFLGLLLGLAFSIGIELMNRRIRTESDVSEMLGVKLLATV
jgi:uncharacterized protein involved in exopolysaccharide biosynthesis